MLVDNETGIPVEFISCPGCGRKYKRGKLVCENCQECKDCHKDNPCSEPKYRKVDNAFLLEIFESN